MGQAGTVSNERLDSQFAPLTYMSVLAVSLPIILSNITTPLLGVTHTAVIGQLGRASLIGAVALGAVIFALLFWAFGFLRMGTTGLCAQADGAGDQPLVTATLVRALLLAFGASVLLLVLKIPLEEICFYLLQAPPAVEAEARAYFSIRIWSAPFALANYAFLGWFIGLGKTRIGLMLQIALNGANVILSIAFVSWLDWGVAGVATATVIAEAFAVVLGAAIAAREIRVRAAPTDWPLVLDARGLWRMLAVNSDLMIRTLCLLAAFTFFTAQAARTGELVLAANAILLNLMEVSAYLLDGFAFTTEVLTGRAIGAAAIDRFRRAIRLSTVLAIAVAATIGLAYALAGAAIIDALTTSADVRETARIYLPWAVAAPLAGVACYQLDGIFIGATRTADMRNMMIVSLAAFFAAWAALTPLFGNHGLWASMIVFFIARALTLAAYLPALQRDSFGLTTASSPNVRRPGR